MENNYFYQERIDNETDQIINFKEFLIECLNKWYLFVIFLFLSLSLVFVFNRFAKPLYKVKVKILVKNEFDPVRNELLKNLGIVSSSSMIENEIGILKSKEILKKTLLDLNFNVTYYKDGIIKKEISNQPFEIEINSRSIPTNILFNLEYINDSIFILKGFSKSLNIIDYYDNKVLNVLKNYSYFDTLKFGDSIKNQYFNFRIVKKIASKNINENNKKFLFSFNSLIQQIRQYSNFEVKNIQNSSILEIEVKSSNPERSVKFLNKLAENYLIKGIERDEQIAINTIKFIDEQLSEFSDSLKFSENMLQQFKSNNKLLDLGYQSQQTWDKIQSIQEEKIRLIIRKRYYEYLREYLQKNEDIKNVVVPSSMNIDDPILNNLLLELLNSYSEFNELVYNSKKDNPLILSLEAKMQELKKKLIENINNNLNNINLAISEKDKQIESYESLLVQMPLKEQQLYRIERKYKLNDALVTFLLTKRSEMQIARAANIPKNEILDKAESYEAIKIRPNVKLNFLLGLFSGLVIPALIIYIVKFFDNVISSKKELESIIPDVPIIGQIVKIKNHFFDVINIEPIVTECFNTLKASLLILEKNKKVFFITSLIANEGKSFVSYNLARTFALSAKKTVLVDFDLRNSNYKKYLNLNFNEGIVTYLLDSKPIDDIIKNLYENFDIIPAGPFLYHHFDFDNNIKIETMFAYLRNRYDCIIIDTPPAGIVSDFLILSKYSDVNIFVVKENYTPKQNFLELYGIFQKLNIKFYVVYNSKEKGNTYYYKYGYYYKNQIMFNNLL